MISVKEAENIIFQEKFSAQIQEVPLLEAMGHSLAADISADRPFPPFDRVAMDGIAIRFEAFERGTREFEPEAILTAGEAQVSLSGSENCVEIMTGAVLPIGADTVIPYEQVERSENAFRVLTESVKVGQNIHFKGTDTQAGAILVQKNTLIGSAEIGIAASVGMEKISVQMPPAIAIVATGNELVPIATSPLPHQIRISNSFSLASALLARGYQVTKYHLKDSKEELEKELTKILAEFSIIIMIGGASKGKTDYVPGVMETLGVKKQFHGVKQRPGKPFWFGRGGKQFVFGLPGNPVSAFLCFYRYIDPWIKNCLGGNSGFNQAILASDFQFHKPMTLFLQGSGKNEKGEIRVTPAPGGGSGDLTNLSKTNGFIELPSEKTDFKAGEIYPWIPFR